MVELVETFYRDGTIRARVTGSPGLCRVEPAKPLAFAGREIPGYLRVTQNRSKHGRRYSWFATYEAAAAAALAWATRKAKAAERTRQIAT